MKILYYIYVLIVFLNIVKPISNKLIHLMTKKNKKIHKNKNFTKFLKTSNIFKIFKYSIRINTKYKWNHNLIFINNKEKAINLFIFLLLLCLLCYVRCITVFSLVCFIQGCI